MFVRIRHGGNEELLVNPNCSVVNFIKFIRGKVSSVDVDGGAAPSGGFDAVVDNAEEPICIIEKRLDLTNEAGLIQGLDQLQPTELASEQLCPENGLTLNRDEEPGQLFVVVEKRLISFSTSDSQLTAIKKTLEADGRSLYEKTLGGIVSVVKSSSGRTRRGSVTSSQSPSLQSRTSLTQSPTNSLRLSANNHRPSSSNRPSLESLSFANLVQEKSSPNAVVERFYYHPLLLDIHSLLPDYVIHRAEDKSLGAPVRPKMGRGQSNKSAGSGSGRLSPRPQIRRRTSGNVVPPLDLGRRSSRSPVNNNSQN